MGLNLKQKQKPFLNTEQWQQKAGQPEPVSRWWWTYPLSDLGLTLGTTPCISKKILKGCLHKLCSKISATLLRKSVLLINLSLPVTFAFPVYCHLALLIMENCFASLILYYCQKISVGQNIIMYQVPLGLRVSWNTFQKSVQLLFLNISPL